MIVHFVCFIDTCTVGLEGCVSLGFGLGVRKVGYGWSWLVGGRHVRRMFVEVGTDWGIGFWGVWMGGCWKFNWAAWTYLT